MNNGNVGINRHEPFTKTESVGGNIMGGQRTIGGDQFMMTYYQE